MSIDSEELKMLRTLVDACKESNCGDADDFSRRLSDLYGELTPETASWLLDEVHRLKAELALAKIETQDLRMLVKEMDLMFGRTLLGMRGAVIEWQHGQGADAGMQWIWNGLVGPGELPPEEETQSQVYFDREVVKIEEGLEEVYAYRDKRRIEVAAFKSAAQNSPEAQ